MSANKYSTKYLKVCLFFSAAYLLQNAASYDGEIWHTDAWQPCPGHVLGFHIYRGRRYENDIFPIFFWHSCCLYHLAGWLQRRLLTAWLQRRLLLWRRRHVTISLVQCRSLTSALPSSLSQNQTVVARNGAQQLVNNKLQCGNMLPKLVNK